MSLPDSPSGEVRFFVLADTGQPHTEPPPPPEGLTRSLWVPSWRRIRPSGVAGRRWVAWWLFHYLQVFANRGYCVVLVHDRLGRVVHRACSFPRYRRFPFMASGDIQIGDVWTAEEWSGRGLATASLLCLVSARRAPGRKFWYVTGRQNTASVRVAERAGFQCVGTGSRVSSFGVGSLAAFRIEHPSVGRETMS